MYNKHTKEGEKYMITTKELQFVNTWANRIPMPGIEYSTKVLEEMKECYETYKKNTKTKNTI